MKAWKKFLFTDTDESLEVTIEEVNSLPTHRNTSLSR